MNRKIIFVTITVMIIASLLMAADWHWKNPEKPTVAFHGTEVCGDILQPGVVSDKDGKIHTYGLVQKCIDSTDDPLMSGDVTIHIWKVVAPKKGNAGWLWASFSLKNDMTEWQGFRWGRMTPDGVVRVNAWAWATRGIGIHNKHAIWGFNGADPAVIDGWYEENY